MTTAETDLTKSGRVKSDGKDPTLGRTKDLSAKSLFQYKNNCMWVTTRPHHPELAEKILDELPQGYIWGCKRHPYEDMFPSPSLVVKKLVFDLCAFILINCDKIKTVLSCLSCH